MEAVRWFQLVVTKRYSAFDGRAHRAEFWWYLLAVVVINFVLALLQSPTHARILTAIFGLVIFSPTVAVYIRRLHDIDRSGWWLLIGCIPFIGGLVLLYWFILPGTSGPNKFGPDPRTGMVV